MKGKDLLGKTERKKGINGITPEETQTLAG